jgi:hypothetical protein
MRALISCTATMSGKVMTMVQLSEQLNCAPACE